MSTEIPAVTLDGGQPSGLRTYPPPVDETHAIRTLSAEVRERATSIIVGTEQNEDPTRGTAPVTDHTPGGTRSVNVPVDDAFTVLVAPARDCMVSNTLGIGIGGDPSRITSPLIVPDPLSTFLVAWMESEHPLVRHATPRRIEPDQRHDTGLCCHVRPADDVEFGPSPSADPFHIELTSDPRLTSTPG